MESSSSSPLASYRRYLVGIASTLLKHNADTTVFQSMACLVDDDELYTLFVVFCDWTNEQYHSTARSLGWDRDRIMESMGLMDT